MPRNRTAIVCTSLALAATGLLAAGSSTSYAADSAKTTKSFNYKCKIKAGGFVIDPAKVKTTVSAKLPASVKAGSKLRKRPVRVTLAMPDVVRDNAVNVLRVRKAKGAAPKAHVAVRIGKKNRQVAVKRLHSKKRRVPRKGTWTIKAKGTVSAVKIPKNASGKAKISVPKRLNVKAKLFRRNGKKLPARLNCKAPKKRGLASITITG